MTDFNRPLETLSIAELEQLKMIIDLKQIDQNMRLADEARAEARERWQAEQARWQAQLEQMRIEREKWQAETKKYLNDTKWHPFCAGHHRHHRRRHLYCHCAYTRAHRAHCDWRLALYSPSRSGVIPIGHSCCHHANAAAIIGAQFAR